MQVIINSDNQVAINTEAIQEWNAEIEKTLQRFGHWVTRVEVHLTDENSASKGGDDDIRCLMEARPADKQPVSVEVRAATANEAISEGMRKLERRLGNILDKARTQSRKQR